MPPVRQCMRGFPLGSPPPSSPNHGRDPLRFERVDPGGLSWRLPEKVHPAVFHLSGQFPSRGLGADPTRPPALLSVCSTPEPTHLSSPPPGRELRALWLPRQCARAPPEFQSILLPSY